MIGRALVAAICGLALAACTSSSNEPVVSSGTVDVTDVMRSTTYTVEDRSERLAKAAEQLLTVQGFAYADDLADLALQEDSSNVRAQFVKAVLAPIMAQKGILARVAPLAEKDERLRNEYDLMMAELGTRVPNSTLKSFLLDGEPDIETETDVQDYLDTVAEGFGQIRQFARENKGESLTVMASDTFYEALRKRYYEACVVERLGPYRYRYQCPSTINMLEVTLSRADFEGLQQIAAAYELYLSLYNSYNLEGAIAVAKNREGRESDSPQSVLDELLAEPTFATLREGNAFRKVREMGLDAVSGLRWIMNNQNSLCPMGSTDPRNRLGALFNEGMCIDDRDVTDLAMTLRRVEKVLSGGTTEATFVGRFGNQYTTTVNLGAWMDSPIDDLRSLTPLAWDRCNRVKGVADETVGGLFPNADGNMVLQTVQEDYRCTPW